MHVDTTTATVIFAQADVDDARRVLVARLGDLDAEALHKLYGSTLHTEAHSLGRPIDMRRFVPVETVRAAIGPAKPRRQVRGRKDAAE